MHEGRMQTGWRTANAGSRLKPPIPQEGTVWEASLPAVLRENPPYGMIGGIEETSASFEARSAPRSYPTLKIAPQPRDFRQPVRYARREYASLPTSRDPVCEHHLVSCRIGITRNPRVKKKVRLLMYRLINHRRRVQGQELRQQQTTDNRDAERAAQLRSGAGPQRQREPAEQRGHRRHHDRPITDQAGLVDRFRRIKISLTLTDQREIDHHDGILLDDADQ